MTIYAGIASILALALLALVFALIFKKDFRRDMASPKAHEGAPQEFSFLGLSVKGITIVVIFAIFSTGLWHSLELQSKRDSQNLESNPLSQVDFLPENQDDAIKQIRREHQDAVSYRALLEDFPLENVTDAASLLKAVKTLKKQLEDQDIVQLVRALSFEDPPSIKIREMQAERDGPWTLSGKSVEVRLTVPGDLAANEVRGCPQQKGNHYELISALVIEGISTQANPVYVTVDERAGVISRGQDCQEKYDFLQVSCEIANRIFTDRALTCHNKQAKWNPGIDQRPHAFAVQVNELPITP